MLSDYVQQKDKHNRIFVVHRLDEDTSGVLMVAKNVKIQQALQEKWNDIVTVRDRDTMQQTEVKISELKDYIKERIAL